MGLRHGAPRERTTLWPIGGARANTQEGIFEMEDGHLNEGLQDQLMARRILAVDVGPLAALREAFLQAGELRLLVRDLL